MKLYYETADELKHYGVLGMKWGIRRAKKAGRRYTYKSYGQRKYEKKLNSAKQKKKSQKSIRKIQRKLDMYKDRDINRQEYAKKANLGKSAIKLMLMGPFGMGNYNRMRAAGAGRMGAYAVSNWLSGSFGYPVTLAYSKHVENSTARNFTRKRK